MKPTAYDFKEFYSAPIGGVVQRAITAALTRFWPDPTNRRIMVYGYSEPYTNLFSRADRTLYFMPPDQGAYPWPTGAKNAVAITARTALPLETDSLDGVILIHSLEFTNAIDPHLTEIWRVLKSQGRLIVIVPNRLGFWTRVDWSPFGQGSSFTLGQVQRYLRESLFIPDRSTPLLFAWPLRTRLAIKMAPFLEKYMPFLVPSFAGLHMIEASKQVYAGLALPVKSAQRTKATTLAPASR